MTPSGPISVLWVEVKKASFPLGWRGPRLHTDGAGAAASSWPAPGPPPCSLSAFPAPTLPGLVQQPPAHTPGEPPSHSPPSYSIARRKGIRFGRIAPLLPLAEDLNAPHPGPTGSYLATASSSTRHAGSSPGEAWAPPRRAPRAQGRTIQPAGTPSTGEEAAAWRERAGEQMILLGFHSVPRGGGSHSDGG